MKNNHPSFLEKRTLLLKLPLIIILLALPYAFVAAQTIQYYQTGEEFAGPFPSWKNVKTDFGAKGDGTTDDTQAIQNALNALKTVNTNNWSVLYFPAGTYRISSTLKTVRVDHNDYLGITIVGEDPATTILSWNGASGQDMFSLDAWYAKVGRLTFDGKSKANTGLLRDGGFSTFCELNDLFFKDMSVGIALGGSSGEGQAEHAIERCRFTRCSYAGVTTNNFNVIDVYVWYSLFEDCARGISNGAGSYNAVGNVFLRSTIADLNSDNSLTFVILNNTSIDSRTFMRFPAGLAHVQGNKIYNTLDAVAIPTANSYGGVPTLIGNVIRSRSGNSGPCVTAPYGNHLFVDNTYTVSNPVGTGGRIFNATEQIVDPSTIVVPSVLQLPGTPQNKNRKIFEVKLGTGNDANEIQQKINSAAAEADGTNPIVHIPKGSYSINTTIVVPTKAIQIVGDGGNENATVIGWGGSGTGPGFRLLGPSHVTMRDMMLAFGGPNGTDAMVIENSDQAGGHIFCDQVLANGNSSSDKCYTSVLVDGVENSDVTYVNGAWGEYTNAGVLVKGGTTLSGGGTTNGQVALMFGGLGNNENKIIDVQNGGRVLAYGFRDETPTAGNILNLGPTTGSVSIAGMSWAATPSSTVPFININGFKGTLAYVGNGIGTGYGDTPGSLFIKIAGDGSNGNILSAANVFGSKESINVAGVWRDNTNPKANATLLNCSGAGVNAELQNIPNVVNQVTNASVDANFVLNTLSQIRNFRLAPLTARAAGVTDIRLIRMFMRVGNGKTGLTLKSDGSSSGNISVTSVSVSPTAATVNVNATRQLTATVAPSNATNQSVTWSSSNTSVATVSSSGLVTGKTAGTATITVTTTDGSKTATSAITVTNVSSGGGDGLKGDYYNAKDLSGTVAVTRTDATVNFDWGTGSYATSQPVDNFSTRWTGQVLPKYTETYTFETETDDGVRFWVNDVQLINKWVDQGSTKVTGTISLTAGTKYNIKMEYYENGGGAVARLRWSSASQAYEIIPQSQLFSTSVSTVAVTGVSVSPTTASLTVAATQQLTATVSPSTATNKSVTWASSNTAVATVNASGLVTAVAAGTATITVTTTDGSKTATSAITVTNVSSGGGDGLKGDYYNAKDLSGTVAVTRTDATVNFDWGTGSYATSQPVDNFSTRWTGQVLPKYTETYTFETETDDGVRLWVNDVQLINKWIDQGPTKVTGTIALTAGTKYNIKMEYYENGGGAVARLRWSSASQVYEVIPQSQLFSAVTAAGISVLTTQVPATSDNDQPYELGMKFKSTQAGTITKIRYYKMTGESGTHTGRIWSSTGTQLASVVFSGETASGWQVAALATPLSITANTTYVVSVNNNNVYAVTLSGLQTSIVNGPLSSIADGANGVYNTTPGSFPNSSYNNTDYFRDIVFVSTSGVRLAMEADAANDIVIYPNPTTGEFDIQFENEGSADVIITNPSGQSIVNFKRFGNINEKINLSNHGSGLYLLRIQNSKGVKIRKIVLNK